ncbi:hypothetical protein F4820DRAFT_417285 [Hypoxylon rubiginosum]|uniref:Uncharacterized protein n=1 Tax=Hypoxylon rubiginosum TaxID=110542 RepID=A0ACB9Z5Q7_9PEZI|nr:hypothetical protein F4820DRAFT_417285 [Hypoxylon rubiginosum]
MLIPIRRFFDGMVDQVYMQVLKSYLFTTPLAAYPCLMSNCQENEFKTPQEMLLHLEHCKSFRDKQPFRCPTCNTDEPSRTVPRKCLFSMLKPSPRLHEKFKDFLRSLKASFSSPKASPNPSLYQPGPQPSPCDTSSQFHVPSQHMFDAAKLSLYELPDTGYRELDSSPCLAPVQSSSPVELYSASVSQAGMASIDISPASVSALSEATSNCYIQDKYLPPIYSSQCAGDSGVFVGSLDYTEPDHADWPYSQASQLFEELSTPNPIHLHHFINQPGFRPSLTINTNSVEQQNVHTPIWNGKQTDSGGTLWINTMDGTKKEFLDLKDLPSSSSFSMDTSSLMDIEANPNPLPTERDVPMQKLQSFDNFSPPGSNGSPSSPDHSPDSELTSSHRCSYQNCHFTPSGKPGNFQAYLRKHMSTHCRKSRIRCQYCTKTFTRKDNQRVHARKAHSGQIDPSGF